MKFSSSKCNAQWQRVWQRVHLVHNTDRGKQLPCQLFDVKLAEPAGMQPFVSGQRRSLCPSNRFKTTVGDPRQGLWQHRARAATSSSLGPSCRELTHLFPGPRAGTSSGPEPTLYLLQRKAALTDSPHAAAALRLLPVNILCQVLKPNWSFLLTLTQACKAQPAPPSAAHPRGCLLPALGPATARGRGYLVLSSPGTKLRSSGPTWSPSGNIEHRSEAEDKPNKPPVTSTAEQAEHSRWTSHHPQGPPRAPSSLTQRYTVCSTRS